MANLVTMATLKIVLDYHLLNPQQLCKHCQSPKANERMSGFDVNKDQVLGTTKVISQLGII